MFKADQWLTNQLPFVIYRYPEENVMRGIFQADAFLYKIGNFKSSGFVFAPFTTNGDSVFLKGEYLKEEMGKPKVEEPKAAIEFVEEGKGFYQKLIQDAMSQIEKGYLKKVVLSRFINTTTTQSPVQIFTSLLAKYPSAFCYWWYHPKIGMWFGATPEQLLQYQAGEVLTTSLAGTLPVKYDEGPNWTSKEIEEQQMVTDYIAKSLEDSVTGLEISLPSSQRAGRLWHLKSAIRGKLTAINDLEDIVKKMHPTPAVCGLPKKTSLDYILMNEGYDREYYTGYLGPINLDSEEQINLFVNLRCFKYSSGNAKVFVGGGITADSNPDSEWKETQYKSHTILEVL